MTEAPLSERAKNILSIAEECPNQASLEPLLQAVATPTAYDGFEPSGRIHIAQGLRRVDTINKLTSEGVHFKLWVADWFAKLNHKMGGDLKKIQKAGLLMIEIWKACGLDTDKVEFIWASEEINKRSEEYWTLVMDIATKLTLNRVLRCTPIMGRSEADDLSASQIMYPVMQCADIFFLGVNICSLGVDQRKVNMMAIDYCEKVGRRHKPVILSHHMLMGLNGSTKMSKSDPDNTIFMDDDAGEVKRKIKKAFCKPGEVDTNPILEYMQYLIFPVYDEVVVERKEQHGGNLVYKSYDQMLEDFRTEALHPDDLKKAAIKYINQRLEPVREHFKNDPAAKKLLKEVKSYRK